MANCEEILRGYLSWLNDGFKCRDIDGVIQITTPFLDGHNDHIQIYIEQKDDVYILSDDSYMINDLDMNGVDVTSRRGKEKLNLLLKGYGARLEDDTNIVIVSEPEYLERKITNLFQAVLSVNDLHILARTGAERRFKEDVKTYFTSHRFTIGQSPDFTGTSGFTRSFDFIMENEGTKRLVKTVNKPEKRNIDPVLFMWVDIREKAKKKYTPLAVLNDMENKVTSEVENALDHYGIEYICWSGKDMKDWIKDL